MEGVERGDGTVLTPTELARRLGRGDRLTVLDVRDRDEFDQWHVTGPEVDAVQVPHQRFIAARVRENTDELVAGLDEPIVVVCAVGEASDEVAAQLRDIGVDAVNLAGGMTAWALEYVSTDLPCEGATVLQYSRPATGCLAYLVIGDGPAENGETRVAAVIDPLQTFADRYVADAAEYGAEIRWAIDTHVHADHVSGVRAVAAKTDATVVLPDGADARELQFGQSVPLRLVSDDDRISVGSGWLDAVSLPGHTTEMTGFRLADPAHGDLLFAGDSLFLDAVARPDLEVGADEVPEMARRLYATLQQLRTNSAQTRIAPAHVGETTRPTGTGGYFATLAALEADLDLLSLTEEAFVDRVTRSMPDRPANHERLIAVNLGREAVDDETASTLELGPNHCSAG